MGAVAALSLPSPFAFFRALFLNSRFPHYLGAWNRLETKAVSNLCQAVNARPFSFSFISNLTFATRTVRDPVSLLVFHGALSNGCNMEEVEEVIEPTTDCIIGCVAFFMKREKGGELPA